MDREASRGNKKTQRERRKEKGERRRRRGSGSGGGEGNVSCLMSPAYPEDDRLAGGGGMLAWVGTTGVSNCSADKPQPRPCQAEVTGMWW